eukprot:7150757-Lingulodinium_polyedra.AAC.1
MEEHGTTRKHMKTHGGNTLPPAAAGFPWTHTEKRTAGHFRGRPLGPTETPGPLGHRGPLRAANAKRAT